jgi:hypothetical protein
MFRFYSPFYRSNPNMTNYPLGSFPRFAHQEQWAQERRERAIHNSIITRQRKKMHRQQSEAKLMAKIIASWKRIADLIDGLKCSRELAREFRAISRSLKTTSEAWRVERNYSRYLERTLARIHKFTSDWNSRERDLA